MTKTLNVLDKAMFIGLLILVIFIPYSSAMIQGSLFLILLSCYTKRYLLWKNGSIRNSWSLLGFSSQGLAVPLIMISILIILTMPFSSAPELTTKKFFSRFLQQIFLMYVAIEIINTPKRLYIVMVMLLWTMLVVNADVLYQLITGQGFIFSNAMNYERVTGPMRHANDLGTLLITVFPIVLALMVTFNSWAPRIFKTQFLRPLNILCGILFLLILMSLGLTSSRGAWVAFALIMIGGGIYFKKYKWVIGIILMLILYFWLFGLYIVNTRTDIFPEKLITQQNASKSINTNHQSTESLRDDSFLSDSQKEAVEESSHSQNKKINFLNNSRRLEYWQTAMEVIQRYPLIGCGYNAYIQTLQKLKLEPVEYPHNSVLHITTELGLLGVMFYLWFFIVVFIKGLEILRIISNQHHLFLLGAGIFLGIIAWFIHSLLDTPWESLQLSILWWLLIGILLSLKNVARHLKESKGVA